VLLLHRRREHVVHLIALLNEVNDMFAQLEQMDGAADDKVQLLAEQVVTDLCRPCSTAGPYAR
jgi:hypothetical protein